MTESRSVTTRDARALEVVVEGPDDAGLTVVFHHGTPGAAVLGGPVAQAASRAGLRLVTVSRPGYGGSAPHPGRSVASAAADTVDALDALGINTFATVGLSGGGPHALACAALLPDRCLAAASLSGVGPYGASGLDFLAGMGPENIEEFGAALAGTDALSAFLEEQRPTLAEITAEEIIGAMSGLLPPVDRACLSGELGEHLALSFRRSVVGGIDGWRDDDLAFVADWGFELPAITVPLTLWQGDADLMVPPAHGHWLVEALPGVRAHMLAGEGHISMLTTRIDDVLADLAALAGIG